MGPPWLQYLTLFIAFPLSFSSHLSAIFGDAAASQLLRHAARVTLAEPRYIEALLKTSEEPQVGSLARVDLANRIAYRNLSVAFREDEVFVTVDDFFLSTNANFTNYMWPMWFDDHIVDFDVQLPRGEVRVKMEKTSMALRECNLTAPTVNAGARTHWIADAGWTMIGYMMSPALDATLCHILSEHLEELNHSDVTRFSVTSLLPEKARRFLAQQETNLYSRLKHIQVENHQLRILMQIEWNKEINVYDSSAELLESSNNTMLFDMELKGDDMVTVWLEDGIINELIGQVEWDFEWMQESIPVSSPVIPADSRDFLSTLCTQCFFLLNVNARGQPTIQATNDSLVFVKKDSVNLRVVNPDKNVTSVFVEFVLTINAEIRPTFDNGVLRTLVQLLDTNIEMKNGAFPKNWILFMQDLMRGMILDMMWPEIKNAIEELSYGKGVKISRACGIDPRVMAIDIGEGSFALSTRLDLGRLDIEKCVREMKSSIPNPSKLLKGEH